jgi:glycosyltransferase involved in cell wall biosynthesis
MISFAITTHNEREYISNLVEQLLPTLEGTDEIVILDDNSSDPITAKLLLDISFIKGVRFHTLRFSGDFAEHKNKLNSICNEPYIFQIDADEILHPNLLKYVRDIVGHNPDVDLFWVPRVNTVEGLTQEDINNWGWKVNEKGWVLFPDYQGRLYKNTEEIRWEGKVHERIVGHKTSACLPAEEEWSIIHAKEIMRQRQQNELYNRIK